MLVFESVCFEEVH